MKRDDEGGDVSSPAEDRSGEESTTKLPPNRMAEADAGAGASAVPLVLVSARVPPPRSAFLLSSEDTDRLSPGELPPELMAENKHVE